MIRTWCNSPWRSALLAVGGVFASSLVSAAANSPAATNATNATNVGGASSNAAPLPHQRPWKSPVDSFRALLEMPAADQQKLLAVRAPDIRQRLLDKIHEYRSLTREERELRLQATEVRWYLVPLLSEPATNRAARLAPIPQPTRKLVEDRLQHWTLLPPSLRQVLLTNQQTKTVSYLTHFDRTTNAPSPPTEALRRRMQETVERLLKLTQKEKEKTLSTFSEVERQQMEKTIAAFEQLTTAQRGRCVQSFTKFATMTPEDRQGFLKNAELWGQMSPTERQAWRELVSREPILPSLYPRRPVQSNAPVGTNGN